MKYVLLTLAGGLAAFAEPAAYTISASPGSAFELRVDKTGLLSGKTHVFVFSRYSGDLQFDAARPEASKIDFTVDVAGADCLDTWLKPAERKKVLEYALDKEVLDAKKFPKISFAASEFAVSPDGSAQAKGTLTIRGVSKPSTVSVKWKETAGGALEISGSAAIRLPDFGIKPPSAALGAIGTKPDMTLRFTVTAARKQ